MRGQLHASPLLTFETSELGLGKYCHMVEWLQRGFGLVIGFVELYNSQLYYAVYYSTYWSLLNLLSLYQSSGNGFQLSPCLSYSDSVLNDPSVITDRLPPKTKLKSKLCYEWRSVGQSVLVSGTHSGPTNFSFYRLQTFAGLLIGGGGRPLWREVGSVIYNYLQHLTVLVTTFLLGPVENTSPNDSSTVTSSGPTANTFSLLPFTGRYLAKIAVYWLAPNNGEFVVGIRTF
jgi:hypothetical protein